MHALWNNETIKLRISPYSVWMWENTDQKNSEYEPFSPSDYLINNGKASHKYQPYSQPV